MTRIIRQGWNTLRRFPFALLSALAGTLAAVWLIEFPWEESSAYTLLSNFTFISALGISVFLSVSTLAEGFGWKKTTNILINTVALCVLALYLLLLPGPLIDSEGEPLIRYLLFVLAAHLFVSFSPYLQKGGIDEFWAYNKTLFLRFLTAILYTTVLYAGLVLAMYSMDNLLGIEFPQKRYSQLWFVLTGGFNTWFFLAGAPRPGELTPKERSYPAGLKIFVQYVLIPLVTLYILILYLYTGSILIKWQWPSGSVANLVLGFSVAGIFSLLLLYPLRNDDQHRWIRLFSRGYYFALIAPVILLILSIQVRIAAYGVTVNRYFVATLAVWLTGIVIWSLAGNIHTKNIKVIPVSLCLLALLISFGPLGAFEVSKKSQLGRFEALLEQNRLLSDNKKVIPAEHPVPFEDRRQISSIVDWLLRLDGPERLQPWFEENLETAILAVPDDSRYRTFEAEAIVNLIGFEYISRWQTEEVEPKQTGRFNFSSARQGLLPVTGADYYLGSFTFYSHFSEHSVEEEEGGASWNISYHFGKDLLRIEDQSSGSHLETSVKPLVKELLRIYPHRQQRIASSPVPFQNMAFTAGSESLDVLILLESAGGGVMGSDHHDDVDKNGEIILDFVTVDLFVSVK